MADHSSETSARVFANICVPSSLHVFMAKGLNKDTVSFVYADLDGCVL